MKMENERLFSLEYGRYCELLAIAEEHLAAGDAAAAARLAQIAARYAFPANVGLFGSPRLERLLLALGKTIPRAEAARKFRRSGNERQVLHIMSYAKPIGGDSRFVWRWIQEERGSRHSVAITAQAEVERTYSIPDILKQSVMESGGFLHTLQEPMSAPLQQAQELRALCQEMDIVVLHVYPYDIVPILALSVGCDSLKVIFVNHSDHTFWIGGCVAHYIAHLRTQPQQFLRHRRGLNPERSSLLPIPLNYSAPVAGRIQAKRVLGYEPETILLLTIASPFKYSAPGQIGLLDLVLPVVAGLPQVRLIAVGPKSEGAWLAAHKQTDGRVMALGRGWDNDMLYAAADVYLDSVPFSSITSLLEAGSHGVPLLGYGKKNPDLSLLGAGAPGLDGAMTLAFDAESYRALLTRLITDGEFRRESGERLQAQILSLHTHGRWVSAVQEIYAAAERSDGRRCLEGDNDTFSPSSLDLALAQLYSKVQGRMWVRRLIGTFIGTLPYRSRASITWRLYRKGFALCVINLLPSPTDRFFRHLGRLVKSSVGSVPIVNRIWRSHES